MALRQILQIGAEDSDAQVLLFTNENEQKFDLDAGDRYKIDASGGFMVSVWVSANGTHAIVAYDKQTYHGKARPIYKLLDAILAGVYSFFIDRETYIKSLDTLMAAVWKKTR